VSIIEAQRKAIELVDIVGYLAAVEEALVVDKKPRSRR